ncbi:MAG: AraC family transcriptional regulator [Trichocoleus desertorum ATA4-8-CV12]|jgi:AraC-like DNA-binding protein|nr:AraC family transcriptional regulator [Trichocoleus desertorum ATA4-8-CV12]
MINISLSNANSEAKNFLIKCLQTAGFDVVSIENDLVSIQLIHDKFSVTEKPNIQKSIFPSIPRLRGVFEFIELNYHQNIKLKEVAQAVGYSPAYLTDLVRRLTGKTVNNWIIDRRISEACTLLLETNYSVEEIALKVGYQNINHFYCQFRDSYKNTPRSWRESQRCEIV